MVNLKLTLRFSQIRKKKNLISKVSVRSVCNIHYHRDYILQPKTNSFIDHFLIEEAVKLLLLSTFGHASVIFCFWLSYL